MDYKLVVERLQEALGAKNYTDLARKLGLGSGTAVQNWIKRGSLDLNRILEAEPGIDLNWLFFGTDRENRAGGIPLIPTEAVAGYGTPAYLDDQIESYYAVAEFKQADFLIRVKGDSMTPKYKAGDIVACRRIEVVNFWQWHNIYVIATQNQGVLIKRVEQGPEGSISCHSENAAYRPFLVPMNEIVSVAQVLGAITIE